MTRKSNIQFLHKFEAAGQAVGAGLLMLLILGGGKAAVKEQAEIVDFVKTAETSKIELTEDIAKTANLANDFQGAKNTYVAARPAMVRASAVTPQSYANAIQIGGKLLPIQNTGSIYENTSAPLVWQYRHGNGGTIIYGHSTAAVFGHLGGLPVGSVFSVTRNGVTENYQIARKETVTKSEYSTGEMSNYIFDGVFGGTHYDLNLTTCAGTLTANGDATHRLLIFANRI